MTREEVGHAPAVHCSSRAVSSTVRSTAGAPLNRFGARASTCRHWQSRGNSALAGGASPRSSVLVTSHTCDRRDVGVTAVRGGGLNGVMGRRRGTELVI